MSRAEEEIRELLARPALSKTDVTHLVTRVRIVLEERGWKQRYPHLNFYCNWALHSRLSGSALCYTILEQMTDALLAYDSGDSKAIERKVGEILSIEQLRSGFIDLLGELDLPVGAFLERSVWRRLYGQVASLIVDKPLTFPSGKALAKKGNRKIRAIYDRVQDRAKTKGLVIKEFSLFTREDNAVRWRMLVDAGKAPDLSIEGLVLVID